MPADYQKIREENIARYGWDTAVLDLLGQLYSERTHFIFELIQNAEDAGATELAFELMADRLELRHDGRPFTEADVRGICGVGQSRKSGDLTSIGQFGIGFKSVYAYTRSPHVHSGDEHFRIENYVRPYATDPRPAGRDLVRVPLRSRRRARRGRGPRDLRGAGRARAGRPAVPGQHHAAAGGRRRGGRRRSSRGATEVVGGGSAAASPCPRAGPGRRSGWSGTAELEGLGAEAGRGAQAPRGAEPLRVEIAFRAEAGRIVPLDRAPLSVFFPTEKETFLGFIAQGPYRTTPARDNVPAHDPANQALVRETAVLLADVLRELRAAGLLTVAALTALPLEAARFAPGEMFRPLFETVREAIAREELIPAAGGGYRAAGRAQAGRRRWGARAWAPGCWTPSSWARCTGRARPPGSPRSPSARPAPPCCGASCGTRRAWPRSRPRASSRGCPVEFLAAQPDEWIARLYAFLYLHSALWPAARARPVIRLEDGSQVAPFDAGGRPAVYLPGPARSSLPTVRRAVAGSPAARPFLDALELAEPDVVAEVLEIVLPRYDGLDAATLDVAEHDADLDLVMTALEVAPLGAGRRDELLGRLRETAFLIGENAATGEQRLMRPARAVPADQGAGNLLRRATRRPGSRPTATGRGWPSCGAWACGRPSRCAPGPRTRPGTCPSRSSSAATSAGWTGSIPPPRSTAWISRWPIPATPGPSTSGTCCWPRTAGWWPGSWNDRCWRPSTARARRRPGPRSR